MEKKYYTAQETADLFGVKLTNIYIWIKKGFMSPKRGAGGKWQITDDDIDTAIKNLKKHGEFYAKYPNS